MNLPNVVGGGNEVIIGVVSAVDMMTTERLKFGSASGDPRRVTRPAGRFPEVRESISLNHSMTWFVKSETRVTGKPGSGF